MQCLNGFCRSGNEVIGSWVFLIRNLRSGKAYSVTCKHIVCSYDGRNSQVRARILPMSSSGICKRRSWRTAWRNRARKVSVFKAISLLSVMSQSSAEAAFENCMFANQSCSLSGFVCEYTNAGRYQCCGQYTRNIDYNYGNFLLIFRLIHY